MSIKQRVFGAVVRQFHNPTGTGGRLVGWVMSHRRSNVARNRWAVELLDVAPADRVIELGCGPGVAVEALAARATGGVVVGVDQSSVMVGQAARRNAAAIGAGRVRLVHAPVEAGLDGLTEAPFDAALAVNTVGFWPEPAARLARVRSLRRPGGRIAVVSQPRCPGATAETSAAAAEELSRLVREAGFASPRVETLDLRPPAVCVLATNGG
jgi:trans-aconitate methyltransferase